MTLTKEMNEEGDLATTMKKLEEKLRRAQEEIREFKQKTDPPSIITTSTSSTLGPVSHKGYLFRWLESHHQDIVHVGVRNKYVEIFGLRNIRRAGIAGAWPLLHLIGIVLMFAADATKVTTPTCCCRT